MQRFSRMMVPHFKGIINEPDPAYDGLRTGRDASGKKLSETEVFRLWESCPSIELVQSTRRALVAAGFAAHRKEAFGTGFQLFSPEGCVHRLGNRPFRGAQLFEEMWRGEIVPSEVRNMLPDPVVEYYSDCTSREVNRVLARLEEDGQAFVVTDEYHVERSQALYHKRKGEYQLVEVFPPEQVMPEIIDSEVLPNGFRALLQFGSMAVTQRLEKEGVHEKERKAERIYRIIQLFGRRVEEGLAGLLRSDMRLLPNLFPQGMPLEHFEALPPRTEV